MAGVYSSSIVGADPSTGPFTKVLVIDGSAADEIARSSRTDLAARERLVEAKIRAVIDVCVLAESVVAHLGGVAPSCLDHVVHTAVRVPR